MKELIKSLPYLFVLWLFVTIDPIMERYYNWRKIPTKRTIEGFITRKFPK